ncbi:MAG: histidine kinase [Chitinophagaceae bacterium]|nr:histidine kinase [Chitinophagaceae bacterium]
MLCDSSAGVWISSQEKVLYLSPDMKDFKVVPFEQTRRVLRIGPLVQLPGKAILAITDRGLFQYDDPSDSFLQSGYALPATKFSTRILSHHGNIVFLRSETQVYRYNVLTRVTDSLPNREVYRLYPVNEDSVLVSSWTNRCYWYNFPTATILPATPPAGLKEPGTTSFDVKSMVEFAPGRFFMASREGIFEYDTRTKAYKRLRFFMNGRTVATNDYSNCIYADDDGFAWMATIDGIVRFSFSRPEIGLMRIRQLNDDLPVAIDDVRKIVTDRQENLWMATGNGIVCWETSKKKWSVFLPAQGKKDKLEHPSIRGMVYDGRYLILGPTDLGIWLFDPVRHTYTRPLYANAFVKKISERDFVDDMVTLSNGNHVITGRDALYLLDGKTYRIDTINIEPAKGNNNYVYQAKNGNIWLTTNTGLYYLDSTFRLLKEVELPFSNKYISCGFILPDDRLLFHCADGLYTVSCTNKEVKLEKFTPVFDNVFLTTVFQDTNGIIWAASENGIYSFDPVSHKLNLFDHSDNVQGYGFNNNSSFRNKDGIVFLGGINGVNYFQPESFKASEEKLQVYISRVKTGENDSLLQSKNVALDYSFQSSLEIELLAPYFNNPDKVKYRYRLEGFDHEWKNLDNTNTLQFTSLPPGSYTLLVQASVNGVDWISAKNSFSFYIKPPFWFNWWFIVSVLLIAGAIIWQIIKARNKKILEQREELEAEQAVNYFAASLQETSSVKDILWDVAKNCIGRLHFEDCVIYIADYKKKVLIQKAAYGPKSPASYEIKEPLIIPFGQGITGHVALTGKAEIIPDTTRDARYIVDDQFRYSEITVPIVYDGRVLGIIDCEHSKKGFFTQKHLSILKTIASLCANKIVKARAEKEKQLAEKILMDTQRKMADVEMQALRAQMNPHFIFNCLNSINRYIVKSDQATASLYLTRFAKLIRLILDNSNSKSVTLANELEALRLYIEMESIRFEKQFSYTIEVDDDIQADHLFVPPMIIQPYVENAIWHGLLHKESSGELTITVSMQSAGMLLCVIEDNGVGRARAKELRSKSASAKKSLGMKLTEDRLALLGKQAQMEASVEVKDLKTNDGCAAGTKVIIKIPVDS